jgi:hypothetical protein
MGRAAWVVLALHPSYEISKAESVTTKNRLKWLKPNPRMAKTATTKNPKPVVHKSPSKRLKVNSSMGKSVVHKNQFQNFANSKIITTLQKIPHLAKSTNQDRCTNPNPQRRKDKSSFCRCSLQRQKPNQIHLKKAKDWLIMILRIERDGIEFFVNTKTGQTGISITGLARLCGVSPAAITRLLQRLEALIKQRQETVLTKSPSKSPEGNPSKAKTVLTKSPETVLTKSPSKSPEGNPSKAKTVLTKSLSDSTEEKSRMGRPPITEEDLPESLLALLEEEIYMAVGLEYKNVKVITEAAIGKFVEYYAMDAQETRDAAKNAMRKFNRRGVRGWIYDIVEWQPETKPVKPSSRAEELGIAPRYIKVKFDRYITYNHLLNPEITAPMYRLYLYFLDCEIAKNRPDIPTICKHARVSQNNLHNLITRMYKHGLVPDWFELDDSTKSIEAQIRDRLHTELGGQIEVSTMHGPIDLLTPTQLIEVKRIEHWQRGFGQILSKTAEFPDHDRRLHLFGSSQRSLRNIKACCEEFDIKVTFEEVAERLLTAS